jgi:hypothetical protein
METFGQEREEALKKFLELPPGTPDESTFFRVCKRIKPEELMGNLYAWLAEAREGAFTIDGKTIRGSGNTEHHALQVVSAWAGDASQVTSGHAPENLNILRKMALGLLRTAPDPRSSGKKRKMTGPKRRFTAAMNPGYMLTVLFGK